MLAKRIVEHSQVDKDVILLYHFCSYAYPNSLQYSQILRNLISQLLTKNSDFCTYINDEYVTGRREISVAVIRDLLNDLLDSINLRSSQAIQARIIIDGMDECSGDEQKKISDFLKILKSKNHILIKILVLSQDKGSLPRLLGKVSVHSSLDTEAGLTKSIETYVTGRLDELRYYLRAGGITDEAINNAAKRIIIRSDGTL